MKHVAVVLSAGIGKRMQLNMPKQYVDVDGRPLICYTLDAFEKSFFDKIVLVVGPGDEIYVQNEILKKEHFTKISKIIPGGAERYNSVYNALCEIEDADYVYIHDGARPCVNQEMLERCKECVEKNETAIAGVPVKDTIKVVTDGIVTDTPNRNTLWQIQTPQAFLYEKIKKAYESMMKSSQHENITDDAMVMETYGDCSVNIYLGDYKNIKVTTPEDLEIMRVYLGKK